MSTPGSVLRASGDRLVVVARPLAVPLLATLVAVGVGLLLIVAAGAPLGEAVTVLRDGMYGTPFALGSSLNAVALLALVGGGFLLAARAGLTNVGGEGQINIGGLAAAAIGLHGAAGLPGPSAVAIPLLAAVAGGALWGALAGGLKAWRGTNEVISTLLLNFVAIGLVALSVQEESLLRQPATSAQTLPNSPPLPDSTHLALLGLGSGSPGTIGIALAGAVLVLIAVTVRRSAFGLRMRAVALGPHAAFRAGILPGRTEVSALAIAGGCGGLAGGLLVLSAPFVLQDGFSSGYGFQGLVVGLLARGSAIGVVLAAVLFGFLRTGGIALEVGVAVPSSVVLVVQAVLAIAIAGTAGLALGRRRPGAVAA